MLLCCEHIKAAETHRRGKIYFRTGQGRVYLLRTRWRMSANSSTRMQSLLLLPVSLLQRVLRGLLKTVVWRRGSVITGIPKEVPAASAANARFHLNIGGDCINIKTFKRIISRLVLPHAVGALHQSVSSKTNFINSK